jgi:hypothetical protein
MDRFTLRQLATLNKQDGADRIEAYLRSKGIQTNGVQVRWDDETNTGTVSVLADRDPSDALRTYTPTPTDTEARRSQAIADAKPVIAAIAQKPRADRTPVERVLLGLAAGIRELMD